MPEEEHLQEKDRRFQCFVYHFGGSANSGAKYDVCFIQKDMDSNFTKSEHCQIQRIHKL